MPKAGQVRVVLSTEQCRAAAVWLRTYRPLPPGFFAMPGERFRLYRNLIRLSIQLEKAGRRKAGPKAVRLVDRHLATWFDRREEVFVFLGLPIPSGVVQVMRACRDATRKRVGAKRKTRSLRELNNAPMISKNDHGRYLQRLRKMARLAPRRPGTWHARLRARSEEFLATIEAPK